jgi:membrane protease YdiL (CAAX protease family)
MSLRMFHMVFIGVSVILAAFFAAWAGGQYRLEHEGIYALTAAGSLLIGGGLAWYGTVFQRKTKNL